MASYDIYNFLDRIYGTTHPGVTYTIDLNGSPPDLTDASIKCQFRVKPTDSKVQKEFSVGSGITITDPTNGVFQIDAFDIDITPGLYYYDILITFADDTKKVYIVGTFKVVQNVTQNG